MELQTVLYKARRWLLRWAAPRGSAPRARLARGRDRARRFLTRPPRPARACRPLSVYDARALGAFFRRCGGPPLRWSPGGLEPGEAGAVRFILGLLQGRADLRRRFPRGLTEGPDGRFCRWLCSAGAQELGLSPEAAARVRAAFARRPGEQVRRLYDHRPDLRRLFPLALTPPGHRPFVRRLLRQREPGVAAEEIGWFLLECAEDPHQGVVATYLRTPLWQELFPHGLTVLGQHDLLAWVRAHYGVAPGWLNPADLAGTLHPVDELRELHAAAPDLRTPEARPSHAPGELRRVLGWLHADEERRAKPDRLWRQRLETGLARGLAEAPGVNVLGHFCHVSGLREATLAAVEALHGAGLRTSCRDVPAMPGTDLAGRDDHLGLELFDCTLLYVAPEPLMDRCYPLAGLARRDGVHRIAVWYVELEEVPAEWARHAEVVREIWAPSRFIAEALRRALPMPVIDMPPGLRTGPVAPLPRSHFGLPEDRFLFLFVFDLASIMERKNPLGLIRAYREAFGPGDRAALAIKVSRGDLYRRDFDRLRRAADEAGVTVIDGLMGREECLALLAACDCYVSLHRSEGFGLTMAEAMWLGKPVIATGYSGNLDFMTADNSLLVGYRRVPVAEDVPVYRKGCAWAEPSVEEAAALMRRVYEEPDLARALGERAQRDVSRSLSLEAAGRRMRDRLQAIWAGGASAAGPAAA